MIGGSTPLGLGVVLVVARQAITLANKPLSRLVDALGNLDSREKLVLVDDRELGVINEVGLLWSVSRL